MGHLKESCAFRRTKCGCNWCDREMHGSRQGRRCSIFWGSQLLFQLIMIIVRVAAKCRTSSLARVLLVSGNAAISLSLAIACRYDRQKMRVRPNKQKCAAHRGAFFYLLLNLIG